MNHIKSYDAFHEDNAHLYEGNEEANEESISPTVYNSILERAFGNLKRKEGALLEHGVDDAFLQDLGDLAQVNSKGEMEHLNENFVELLESFNSYYSLALPMPKNPRAVFESLEDWYSENEENITPERFEQKFAMAVIAEDIDGDDSQENLHDSHLRPNHDKTSTVAEDEAKIPGIVSKAAGTLTPEEFTMLCKSRIRARGQASTKDKYKELHARWNEEIEAHQKANPSKPLVEPSRQAMDDFNNTPSAGIAPNLNQGAE